MPKKLIPIGFALLFCLSLFSINGGAAETWSFGIYSDTQWKPVDEENNGVAIFIIDALNKEMIAAQVDLVVQVGDLVQSSSQKAFDTRAARNAALKEAGIAFYPFRGNHDSQSPESAKQFAQAFPGLPGTPGAGGSSPKLPGIAGLTYAFVHKNVKFIILDICPLLDESGKEIEYSIADFLPWMREELSKKDHEHAFVFSHIPLIGQSHKGNLFVDLGKDEPLARQDEPVEVQNAFYKLLADEGVRYYFCGHDHMYQRSTVVSPDGKHAIEQILCGSDANKCYRPKPPLSPRQTLLATDYDRTTYQIVTIDGPTVRVQHFSAPMFGTEPTEPVWDLRETYGYTKEDLRKPLRPLRRGPMRFPQPLGSGI